jgi:23S rRNA A1618 N6-methylase RlmF
MRNKEQRIKNKDNEERKTMNKEQRTKNKDKRRISDWCMVSGEISFVPFVIQNSNFLTSLTSVTS